MSPKERRAFAAGYRLALRRARVELDATARRLDTELAKLDKRMRAAHERTARSIDAEIDGVRAEMRAARAEFYRYRAIEEAVSTERDFDVWLN